jgi:transcriptional regulator with XRE-family HTH domain
MAEESRKKSQLKIEAGGRLRTARKTAGLTLEAVADRLGLARQSIAHWEMGRSFPGPEGLKEVADLYGVTTDWILGRQSDLETVMNEPELALRSSRDELSEEALREIAEFIRWKRAQGQRANDETGSE